jgi:Zn-finger nucleic acid-binding protein
MMNMNKIVCPNCGYSFESGFPNEGNINQCPKCGAPYMNELTGITWAK